MMILVAGTGRCGSTPLAEVIARHPDVGFVSNLDDKLPRLNLRGRFNKSLYRRSGPRDPRLRPFRDRRRLIEAGRIRIAPSEAWNVLDHQIGPMFSTPCRDLLASDLTLWLEERIRRFFERRMQAQGTKHFVQHLTGWPRTGLLQAVFPDTRVVHVVRDGRAVANSWLQMGWWNGWEGPSKWYLGPLPPAYQEEWEQSGRSFVLLAGLGWKLLIDAFEAARFATDPSRWIDVRYEDLLADPRGELERVSVFLGLDWGGAFDASFSRYSFPASRAEAFRRELDAESLGLLDTSLGAHLGRWGYETAQSARGDREAHRATWGS